MRILKYHCHVEGENGWDFPEVQFGRINLLVGNTGTGKTRFLNTIFNLGYFAVNKKIANGTWELTFEHKNKKYIWFLECDRNNENQPEINKEKLIELHPDKGEIILVDRDRDKFIFKNDLLPKLSRFETSISLLKNEEEIKIIHDGFSKIMRRRFDVDSSNQVFGYGTITAGLLEKFSNTSDLNSLYEADLPLNIKFFVLEKTFPKIYAKITKLIVEIFPFIKKISIRDVSSVSGKNIIMGGIVPIIIINEHSVQKDIQFNELSSGMKKTFLILTDILTLPPESVYMIDEYENSLGLNAIDFFPVYVNSVDDNFQIILTSHHPYIVNSIPVKNWFVFRRKGLKVEIKFGEELEERYGKSKQQSFVQLINDPFFEQGVL